MSEIGRKPSRAQTKKKPGGKTAVKRAGQKQAACVDGAEELRQAVNRHVNEKAERIASALADKALTGNAAAAKAMVELAEGRKPEPEKEKKRGLTLAQRLAMEPQWDGPPEFGQDVGFGGREPE